MTQSSRTVWTRRVGWTVALVVVFLLGYTLRGGNSQAPSDEGAESVATTWTCSMHPQIQLPEPSGCPLCGMDLIPLEEGEDDGGSAFSIRLSPSALALAEIQTTTATRGVAEMELGLFGKLVANETTVRRVSAWVPGRIERLHVSYTGQRVRKGQKLFDLFSPDLYSAQEELLQVLRSRQVMGGERAVEAAREKLLLLGLSAEDIAAVEESGQARNTVSITAPIAGTVTERKAIEGAYVKTGDPVYTIADLSRLWLELEAYESDLSWLRIGSEVDFSVQALPGERFQGRVTFIDPVLDDRTRTSRVRVEVPNAKGSLKPGMLARGHVQATFRSGAEDSEEPVPLLIPKTAPLLTGERAVVYVADTEEPGRFHGRDVVLGPRAGDHYVVLSGLEEGEEVVSNGSFKIDSALQIRGQRSMMNPGVGSGQVGSNGEVAGETTDPEPKPVADVPASFREQLGAFLDVYFEIATALSLDDAATARTAAQGISSKLTDIDASALSASGRQRWEEARDEIAAAGLGVARANGLDSTRDAFYGLSNLVIRNVRSFGVSSSRPVLVYHCPMARDGAGADWLQNREGTENPYYGSQMYRCGTETDVIVPVSGASSGGGAQ